MKILLIDAYDSFVHIIYQYLLSLDVSVDVIRNDKITNEHIKEQQYDLLIFGPGPGNPKESKYIPIIKSFKNKIPMFGVCLGMQALVEAFNGKVIKANNIMHGKVSNISHTNTACFSNLKNPLPVTRYHSLVAEKDSFPYNQFDIIATSIDDDNIMAIKHKSLPIQGVQFHPESILTESGLNIFKNMLKIVK